MSYQCELINQAQAKHCRKAAEFQVYFFQDRTGAKYSCASHLGHAVRWVSIEASGDEHASTQIVKVRPLEAVSTIAPGRS